MIKFKRYAKQPTMTKGHLKGNYDRLIQFFMN